MTYFIPIQYIKQAKKALDLDYEVCGIIRPLKRNKSVLGLDITDLGEKIKLGERGSCISTNVWLNYHTHPHMVLPWPSTEDVFKILYDRGSDPVLWGCLIFCQWGVWEIFSSKKEAANVIDASFEAWTQKTSDALYHQLNMDTLNAVPPLRIAKKYVLRYIEKWEKRFAHLDLQMMLIPWNSISGDYYFYSQIMNIPPFKEKESKVRKE